MANDLADGPRLPPELIGIILEQLGRSSDGATRNTLLACSLVSSGFCTLARKQFFRKLTIAQFTEYHKPQMIPQREYHLIHVFFNNPGLLGIIEELDILYDSTDKIDDRGRRCLDTDSPVSQDAILDRFPWIGPRPPGLKETRPLYLLLRQSPIHTVRFILRNPWGAQIWRFAPVGHLLPICSMPSLKRAHFVRVIPLQSGRPKLDDPRSEAGLERLDFVWVAQSEEDLEDFPPPGNESQTSVSSTSPTTTPHFPLRQVIRMSVADTEMCTWMRPLQFFQRWFPDYEPSPALVLQDQVSPPWTPTYLMGSAEVRDALDNMHNACPSIQRVSWQKVDIPGRFFFLITIERKGQ